jgi:hypothetical protein
MLDFMYIGYRESMPSLRSVVKENILHGVPSLLGLQKRPVPDDSSRIARDARLYA